MSTVIMNLSGGEDTLRAVLAYKALATTQQAGVHRDLIVALVDNGHDYNPRLAGEHGVELETVLVSQPESQHEADEIQKILTNCGAVALIVVNGTPSSQGWQIEKETGTSQPETHGSVGQD